MKTLEIVAVTEVPPTSLSQPSPADAPVTTTLKLSEAIRLGAMMGPQAFGEFQHKGATCALGAAWKALGDDDEAWLNVLRLEYAVVKDRMCPICGPRANKFRLIPHLNDDHSWTREQIADWVEQFEQ